MLYEKNKTDVYIINIPSLVSCSNYFHISFLVIPHLPCFNDNEQGIPLCPRYKNIKETIYSLWVSLDRENKIIWGCSCFVILICKLSGEEKENIRQDRRWTSIRKKKNSHNTISMLTHSKCMTKGEWLFLKNSFFLSIISPLYIREHKTKSEF